MASSRRSGWLAAASLLIPVALLAQAGGVPRPPGSRAAGAGGPLVLAGRLVRVRSADTAAVAGAFVVAHRIGTREQGPIDSLRSDGAGRFRFVVRTPDTAAVYVVSSRHQGIGYFSEPFGAGARAGGDAVTLAVYDTSSVGPALAVSVRHLVVTRQEEGGGRQTLDIVQVRNSATTTRVAADSLVPSFTMTMPEGIVAFQVGESEISASAIRLDSGRLLVTAPFPPGEKQIVVSYLLPAGRRVLRIPIDVATARLELLAEDSSVSGAGGVRSAEPLTLEGRTFNHFLADSLAPGERPELRFGRTGRGAARDWWPPVLVAVVALLGGAWLAARRRGAPATGAEGSTESLAARIAALDDRYQGLEGDTPADEWAVYQEKRAALKRELAARLARR